MVIRGLGLMATFGIVAGCYSTPAVDPYPEDWIIDDFSRDDRMPTSPLFGKWGCRPKDSDHPELTCEIVPEPPDGTQHMLHLASTLYLTTGIDAFSRSEVITYTTHPVDVTQYESIAIVLTLVVPPSFYPRLILQLMCTQQIDGEGSVAPIPFILYPAIPNNQPDSKYYNKQHDELRVELRKFDCPENPSCAKKNEVTMCKRNVNAIKITVDSNSVAFKPGSSEMSFDLFVHDVRFIAPSGAGSH